MGEPEEYWSWDAQEAEEQLMDALSDPPFCAWCGGNCECDEWKPDND